MGLTIEEDTWVWFGSMELLGRADCLCVRLTCLTKIRVQEILKTQN